MKNRILGLIGLLLLAALPATAQNRSRFVGVFSAADFAYGSNPNVPGLKVGLGSVAAGASGTLTVNLGSISLMDGTKIAPLSILAPIFVGAGATFETVTPTAVSCSTPDVYQTCSFTATFTNAHSAGDPIRSATYGLQEAINYAVGLNGGIVAVDPLWTSYGGTNAILSAATPYWNISIQDSRLGGPQFWNATPGSTVFSAPSALASGTVFSSATVAGSASYTGGTIHVCYALVDIMGNEGPCSSDYSFTDTSAKAVVFTAPPAATGAVGWIPYIGLESGASANEYQMLVYTQPTVIGVLPAGNGVCTLTTIETITPACAITNSTYGQTGSGATVTAYPVVTSPQAVGTGGLSTASYYIGNSNGRTTYAFTPGASIGTPGIVRSSPKFTIATAAGSGVQQGMATISIPSGFMNYVGRSIRVCGHAYSSTQGASTVVAINFYWDAQGSDATTGIPVLLGGPLVTNTLTTGTVADFAFCQDITTTVASASVTGGSILPGYGWLIESALTTGSTPAAGPSNQNTATAVGSLNLAGPARLQIMMKQTTSTTAVPQILNVTVQVLN